jgi:hypothetical protein
VKYIVNFLALLLWIIATLILVCTIVGLMLILDSENDGWMKMGKAFIENLK